MYLTIFGSASYAHLELCVESDYCALESAREARYSGLIFTHRHYTLFV